MILNDKTETVLDRTRIITLITALLLLSILLLSPTGTVKAYTGASFASSFGSYGTSSGQFKNVINVYADQFGNVFVADTDNNRIQKFDQNGNFISAIGTLGTGNEQFNRPTSAVSDRAGNLYVIDSANNRVEKFDSLGNFVLQWSLCSSNCHPYMFNMAIDENDAIYITDQYSDIIRKYDTIGELITSWGGSGSGNGQFLNQYSNNYFGIAVNSFGDVYVTDSGNYRIQKFDSNGNFIKSFDIQNSSTNFNPASIAIDSLNNVYVLDYTNNVVQVFDKNENSIGSFGSTGSGSGQLNGGVGISIDPADNIYIADKGNSRIDVFHANNVSSSVYMVSPSWKSVVSGTTTLVAMSISGSLVGATYYLDGSQLAIESTTTPYSLVWDTTSAAPGIHTIFAVGRYIDGSYSTSTSIMVTVKQTTAPTVSAPSISSIGTSSADISSLITDSSYGNSSNIGFNYGHTVNYGLSTSTAGSFSTGQAILASLTNLSCNTSYHIQSFATNAYGTATSSDSTFTTLTCPTASTTLNISHYYDYSDTLLVINDASATSTTIGNYFINARNFPLSNVVHINASTTENISRTNYNSTIKGPIENFLNTNNLATSTNYVILTKDVPIRISDTGKSVDSDLGACIGKGNSCGLAIAPMSPFFQTNTIFFHQFYGIYLVTRLDGYFISDIERLIDNASSTVILATTPGQFVIDQDPSKNNPSYQQGETWMASSAPMLLSRGYTVNFDQTSTYLTNQKDVQGYYSWGEQ